MGIELITVWMMNEEGRGWRSEDACHIQFEKESAADEANDGGLDVLVLRCVVESSSVMPHKVLKANGESERRG